MRRKGRVRTAEDAAPGDPLGLPQTPWVQVQSVDSMVSRLGQFIAVLCETLPVLIRGAPGPGESL